MIWSGAPDEMGIQIDGIEDTCGLLESLPEEVGRGALGKALMAAAVPISQAIAERTPERSEGERDEEYGHLIDGLRTTVNLRRDGSGGSAVIDFGKQGWKALLVEYGHRMIGHEPEKKQLIGPNTSAGMVVPIPFMREGLDASEEAALEKFCESFSASMTEFNRTGTLRSGDLAVGEGEGE